jgi:signal transduction histidine kinase
MAASVTGCWAGMTWSCSPIRNHDGTSFHSGRSPRRCIRTEHAGVGLGLPIVKSITQAHDGTLTLTPRAAGGLRVTVQLPAAG